MRTNHPPLSFWWHADCEQNRAISVKLCAGSSKKQCCPEHHNFLTPSLQQGLRPYLPPYSGKSTPIASFALCLSSPRAGHKFDGVHLLTWLPPSIPPFLCLFLAPALHNLHYWMLCPGSSQVSADPHQLPVDWHELIFCALNLTTLCDFQLFPRIIPAPCLSDLSLPLPQTCFLNPMTMKLPEA